MPKARPCRPGATLFITRRTNEGHFLLIPHAEVANAFFYLLSYCASLSNIRIHSAVLMSDLYHLEVTDPDGRVYEFIALFHTLVSQVIRSLRRWNGPVWQPHRQTSVAPILDEESMVERALFIQMSPVRAGIVKHDDRWPGFVLKEKSDWERPELFVRHPTMPETVTLCLEAPPGFSDNEWQTQKESLRPKVKKDARSIGRKFAKSRGSSVFRGVKHALQLSPTFKPHTFNGSHKRTPLFISQCEEKIDAAYRRLKNFVDAYDIALANLKDTGRATFPEGTWKMARLLGQLSRT